MNQSIEDRKRLLTDKDFFDCFRLCDADLDGEIGVADLRRLFDSGLSCFLKTGFMLVSSRILKFSGLPYSKKDALAMIQMADPAATTLRWDTFRRIMHCDLVGHSKEDYYQALSSAPVSFPIVVRVFFSYHFFSVHVPRIDGQLLVERSTPNVFWFLMKQTRRCSCPDDLKRNLLAFVRLNDYTLARLSTLLREFLDVQRQNKFEVMMEFKVSNNPPVPFFASSKISHFDSGARSIHGMCQGRNRVHHHISQT